MNITADMCSLDRGFIATAVYCNRIIQNVGNQCPTSRCNTLFRVATTIMSTTEQQNNNELRNCKTVDIIYTPHTYNCNNSVNIA
jgi:hypothetical protein